LKVKYSPINCLFKRLCYLHQVLPWMPPCQHIGAYPVAAVSGFVGHLRGKGLLEYWNCSWLLSSISSSFYYYCLYLSFMNVFSCSCTFLFYHRLPPSSVTNIWPYLLELQVAKARERIFKRRTSMEDKKNWITKSKYFYMTRMFKFLEISVPTRS
jgi:hypothetical protein